MADLRIPSLQHLVRHWRPEANSVRRSLISLALNTPTFNYNALFGAIRDMLLFQQPYDEIVKGISRISRSDVRENLLSVLPLLREYFDNVTPAFVQSVERRFYPVGRDLLVPFDPPLIYGLGGQIHFPWFSFWRSNPLSGPRLSLFTTLVEDLLQQDPDLETARFTILDFSAPKAGQPRELKVVDAASIPRVTEDEKRSMLQVLAEGFALAQTELRTGKASSQENARPTQQDPLSDQPDLFGWSTD